jgi:hypothetical protein
MAKQIVYVPYCDSCGAAALDEPVFVALGDTAKMLDLCQRCNDSLTHRLSTWLELGRVAPMRKVTAAMAAGRKASALDTAANSSRDTSHISPVAEAFADALHNGVIRGGRKR